MLVKVHVKPLLLVLFLAAFSVQGCTVSEQSGTGGGSSTTSSIRLSLSTTNGSSTLIADGTSTLPVQITVANSAGQGLANTVVTFATTAGTLAVASGTTAVRASEDDALPTTRSNHTSTVLTGADGTAQVLLTSSTVVETATITAEALGFSTALTVDFISGVPDQIALSAIPSTVGIGSTSTIQATVTAADGSPIEGATVTLSFTANNSGAQLSATSGSTDVNGRFTVSYLAGTSIGSDTIKATVSTTISATTTISVQSTSVNASDLQLLVSSPQLDSDGSETVTLTALARDSNNNFVAGVDVSFAASSGGIQIVSGTTDATGTATALLFTAGDPSKRTITVTATAGTLVSTNTVNVTGTTVTLSGTSALVLGETTTLSILLRDSGGDGITSQVVTLSSTLGNTLSVTSVTTDSNGQATFQVTAAVAGTDTISATALGVTGTLSLAVSSANFVFTTPGAGAEVNLGAVQAVTVHWDEAGVNQVGQTINFFATRGTLSAASAVTDANGNASITITSNNAGPAVITAAATTAGGPSSQIEIEFIATTPSSLILQASPTTVGINAEGTSDQQSIITAVVRDASGNLVKNQTVSFTLTDVSGGSIFPAAAITDSFGRASTVYTAGAATSAQDGVLIDAEVSGTVGCVPTATIPTGPCDRVTLTVGQQAFSIVLGTSHLIQALSDTQYAKPYSVLVTDANGNPVQGATVELNHYPTRYQKGFYALFFDSFGLCTGWGKVLTVTGASTVPNADNADQACTNEDVNRNGILNPGEDTNNNGVLDPGNVVAVPASVVTDATGFALFDLVYAREFTWVEIELEARATVSGSEASTTARFFLPGLASDFNDCEVSPPGQVSPFGVATTCGCDELTDATCPTSAGLTPITLVSLSGSTVIANPAGGTLDFTVAGGTQISYTVSSSAGTLTNLTSGQAGSSILVNFGENFRLTTTAGQTGATITLTATDLVTGQTGTTTVTQS